MTAASASAIASAIFVIMDLLLDSKPKWLLFYTGKSSSLRAARFIGIASFGLALPTKRRDREVDSSNQINLLARSPHARGTLRLSAFLLRKNEPERPLRSASGR